MNSSKEVQKKSFFNKFLQVIEDGGNKLPHPITMFFYFFIGIIILSAILSLFGVSVEYSEISRSTNEVVQRVKVVENLLTKTGIRNILGSAVNNFTSHAALGSIVVAMLGVGVSEGTGLLGALIKKLVLSTPARLVSAIVVFTGVMSNIASDAGYVVLIPLGAVIFASFGRHPLAGIAAAFAGVSGGFSANLLLGTLDPLLGGISTNAAQIVLPGYYVNPTANYFFMFVSTFLVTIVGAWITDKIVEPRLGKYDGPKLEIDTKSQLTSLEQRGIKASGITILILISLVCLMVIPENGILRLTSEEIAKFTEVNNRAPELMEILTPFFRDSIVFILMLIFMIPGVIYGVVAKTVSSQNDIIRSLVKAMESCAQVFVILFISAQFAYVFRTSNIGIIIAVNLANVVNNMGIGGVAAAVGLIFLTAVVNLFIGGASSKWLMLSPVFIPMFVELGLTPEYTQLAYRIGDSATNIISPLMSYFPIIVGFAAKYAKSKDGIGVGTIIAMMLPYSLFFLISWVVLFIAWSLTGLPIGPGVSIFL